MVTMLSYVVWGSIGWTAITVVNDVSGTITNGVNEIADDIVVETKKVTKVILALMLAVASSMCRRTRGANSAPSSST